MGGSQSGVLNGGPNGGGGFSTLPPPSYLHGDLIAAPGVQMGGGLRWGALHSSPVTERAGFDRRQRFGRRRLLGDIRATAALAWPPPPPKSPKPGGRMGAGGAQGPRVASGSARFWGGSRLGFGSGMRTDAFSARWQRPTHSERRFGGKNPKNQILPRGVWGRYDARWHTAPQIPPAWGRQRGDGAVALRGRGCPRASVSPRGSSSPPLSPPPSALRW